MKGNKTMSKQKADILDIIIEEKSDVTIDEFIATLPKGQQKKTAQDLITKLHSDLSTVLVNQKIQETRLKKLVAKLKDTEPMKAMKALKSEIKRDKKEAERLALIMLGAKKMCKVMGVELPDIKALTTGD